MEQNGEKMDNAHERFMIVVPEALHSFPVCQEILLELISNLNI